MTVCASLLFCLTQHRGVQEVWERITPKNLYFNVKYLVSINVNLSKHFVSLHRGQEFQLAITGLQLWKPAAGH
jgi:hypothetical protein